MSAAAPAAERRSAPNGLWGMALFLCAEVALFGTFIGAYFFLDFNSRSWPPPGVPRPEVLLPLLATAGLLTTLVPIRFGARAARRGRAAPAIGWIASAALLQAGYLAGQILLFRHDLRDFSPQRSAYGSIYFTLLAAHHAHVLLGLLLDLVVAAKLATRGAIRYWVIAARGLALYWSVVGGLAVAVVLTQLTPSL
jgi:cytochrome o ubiquinol oxidase subunit 3